MHCVSTSVAATTDITIGIVMAIGIAMEIVETQCIASLPRNKRICHFRQFSQCQIIGV